MAVIISFLSKYSEKANEEEYFLPDPVNEEDYKGVHTNQAPLYYLTKCAKNNLKENETIKYLFIVSKEVYYNKVHNEKFTPRKLGDTPTKSQYEYYEHFCKDLSKECEVKCEVFHIPYDFEKNVQENSAPLESKFIANNIYQKINEKIEDKEKVYIDYTGGFRDTSYLLVTLIQYLEIKNVTCESIVYSQQKPNKIRRIRYIYKINTIIQGAHDFIATGDITKLKEFFEEEQKSHGEEKDYKDIIELINKLDEFVKAVSIGQIDGLDTIKNNINDYINGFDANVTTDSEADLYRSIFKLLFPKIKESLFIKADNKDNQDNQDNQDNKFGYVEIVKWCIAHRFIQQACTIYVEKFPEIYLNAGINKFIGRKQVKDKNLGSSIESAKFYTDFWDCAGDSAALFGQKIAGVFKGVFNLNFDDLCNYLENGTNDDDKKQKIEQNVFPTWKVGESAPELVPNQIFTDAEIQKLSESDKFTASWLRSFWYKKPINFKKIGCELIGPRYVYISTYEKKKKTIERLASRNNSNDYELLVNIMRAYLCIKITRNHLSHVSTIGSQNTSNNNRCSDDNSIFRRTAVELLGETIQDYNSPVYNLPVYDLIVEILKKGAELTEAAEKTGLLTDELCKELLEIKIPETTTTSN